MGELEGGQKRGEVLTIGLVQADYMLVSVVDMPVDYYPVDIFYMV